MSNSHGKFTWSAFFTCLQMMVEKKQAQRQTQVLSNNACPNAVLAQALEDVSTMAARLEEEHKLREKFGIFFDSKLKW